MRLKPLSLLILIALALLLSGGNSSATESPSQPNQSTQTQTPAQQHNAITSATVSVLYQATAIPSTGAGATNNYYYYEQTGPWRNLPSWLEAVATILLVLFAGWQMRFVRRSTTATENAANAASANAKAAKDAAIATERYVEMTAQMVKAAEKSAEAAKAAIHINRPFIWVPKVVYVPSDQEARFTYQNAGNSAAEILEIIAEPKIYFGPVDVPPAMFIPEVSYDGAPTIRVGQPILPIGEQSGFIPIPFDVDAGVGVYGQPPFEKVVPRLAFVGRIKYRGGPPDDYYFTPFFFWFSQWADGFFYRGPEELNSRT